jgi:hypothetical protein
VDAPLLVYRRIDCGRSPRDHWVEVAITVLAGESQRGGRIGICRVNNHRHRVKGRDALVLESQVLFSESCRTNAPHSNPVQANEYG